MKCKAYDPQGSQGRARNGAVIKQRDCDSKERGILFFFFSWGNPGRFVFRTGVPTGTTGNCSLVRPPPSHDIPLLPFKDL